MDRAKENRRLSTRLAVVALTMFGFGFALVPFYEQICVALGINRIQRADEVVNTQVDASRTISIEFDSNTHDLPWRFRPLVNHSEVHPGELTTVEYEGGDVGDGPSTGQAGPGHGPQDAGELSRVSRRAWRSKQPPGPGGARRMPGTFVVDPRLPKSVTSSALSCTFFEGAGRGGNG